MSRPSYSVLTAAVILTTALLTQVVQGDDQAASQAVRPATASTSITPEQAAPFVGNWLVTLSMGANNVSVAVAVTADAGKVAAIVTSDAQQTTNVTDISLAGKSLVLKYVTSMQGTPLSNVMTLTPDAAGMRANLAVMDGQYEMPGTAAKQAPGAAAAPTGFGGGGRGAMTSDATDFTPKPAYTARTPEEEGKGFMLPAGYRMELVAADPDVISPTLIEFDGNGRMYVGEMISYMMDASARREHDPISRISRWESTKGDGRYDKRTVFVDHLVAPRMILPLQDGVILTSETDSDDLVKWSDTNDDGVADKREVVFSGIGQSGDANIEHQKAGLLWNMDNWIYTTYNPFRIRWTPAGFLREPTGANGGQWGLASDDDGKPWFVDAGGERGPMNFQYPIHYGSFTPCPAAGRGGRAGGAAPAPAPTPDPNCPPGMENGFEKDFAVVWPAPGIGDMQGGIGRTRMPAQNLNHFTATTGPAIFRGDRLPEDLKGHLLFTEPVGRLVVQRRLPARPRQMRPAQVRARHRVRLAPRPGLRGGRASQCRLDSTSNAIRAASVPSIPSAAFGPSGTPRSSSSACAFSISSAISCSHATILSLSSLIGDQAQAPPAGELVCAPPPPRRAAATGPSRSCRGSGRSGRARQPSLQASPAPRARGRPAPARRRSGRAGG